MQTTLQGLTQYQTALLAHFESANGYTPTSTNHNPEFILAVITLRHDLVLYAPRLAMLNDDIRYVRTYGDPDWADGLETVRDLLITDVDLLNRYRTTRYNQEGANVQWDLTLRQEVDDPLAAIARLRS